MENKQIHTSNTAPAKSENKGEALKDTAGAAFEETKEKVSHGAKSVVEEAKKRSTSVIHRSKHNLATQLSDVAAAIKHSGDELQQSENVEDTIAYYAKNAGDKIQNVANYLENKDVGEMLRDVEGFARRQPALFVGGAVALGLLAARFVRSSATHQHQSRSRSSQMNRRSSQAMSSNQSTREQSYGQTR
jgi:hypothetical protein